MEENRKASEFTIRIGDRVLSIAKNTRTYKTVFRAVKECMHMLLNGVSNEVRDATVLIPEDQCTAYPTEVSKIYFALFEGLLNIEKGIWLTYAEKKTFQVAGDSYFKGGKDFF